MVNYRNACDVGMQNPSTVWAKAWLDTWITSPDVWNLRTIKLYTITLPFVQKDYIQLSMWLVIQNLHVHHTNRGLKAVFTTSPYVDGVSPQLATIYQVIILLNQEYMLDLVWNKLHLKNQPSHLLALSLLESESFAALVLLVGARCFSGFSSTSSPSSSTSSGSAFSFSSSFSSSLSFSFSFSFSFSCFFFSSSASLGLFWETKSREAKCFVW